MATDDKKGAALEAILGHLLASGMEDAGIRALAKSAGISDRMLIYYFGSKDALLREVFAALSLRTSEGLNLLLPEGRYTASAILSVLDDAFAIPEFTNAMKLILEVAARASRGLEPYRTSAREIVAFWLEWLGARLDAESDGKTANELLVEIEGRILLRLIADG